MPVGPLIYCGHLIDEHKHKCLCCQEVVGKDDAKSICKQLENREKNCMWCGDDFDLTEEEIVYLLDDCVNIIKFADRMNKKSDLQSYYNTDSNAGHIMWIKMEDEKKREFEKKRKKAIMIHYGIDIDKEKFDPGYVDKKGNPWDRINDAVPYEEIRRDDLPHKILQFVEKNSDCTGADIKKKVRFSRVSRIRNLIHHPISRLYASTLIDCTSDFIGFVDMSAVAERNPSGYFGPMPRFSRKYFITSHGIGVLKELDGKRKEVLL